MLIRWSALTWESVFVVVVYTKLHRFSISTFLSALQFIHDNLKIGLNVDVLLHSIYIRKISSYPVFGKGVFFSESAMCFFKSPNLQKKYSKKTILYLKFKFPANNIILVHLLSQNLFWVHSNFSSILHF